MFRTVTARLTLWYAALFTVLSLAAFGLVYINLAANLSRRVDTRLRKDAQELASLYRTRGIQALQAEFVREAESDGNKRVFFRLLSPGAKLLAASDLSAWQGLGRQLPMAAALPVGGQALKTVAVPGRSARIRFIAKKTANGDILQVGFALPDNEDALEDYRDTFGAVIVLMVLCGGIMAYFVARRAMGGVERVTQTALRIGSGDFTHRLPLGNEGEEIDNLARAFNDMLERLELLIRELKEVTDNIAHDLRSPITRIRGVAETTLTGGQGLEEYREMAGVVVEESDRLVGMINTMLDIAEADAGVAEHARAAVDMARIVREAAELFRPVAEDKGVCLHVAAPAGPLVISGDVERLQRVMANLVDNAIKYTPPGGTIRLAAREGSGQVMVSVTDTGAGISAKDLPQIFDRFFRSDQSRSTPGSGLGLSLARAVVRAHGGEITVKSELGRGSAFVILLPRRISSP